MVLTSVFQLRYLYDYQDSVIEHKWPTDSGLLSFYIMAAGDIYRELAADRIFDCGYISEKLRILNNINQMTVGDLTEIRDTRIQYQDYPARLNEFKAKVEKFEQITASFDFGEYGYRRKAMLIALQVIKQLCDWGITGNNMKVEDVRKLLIILQKEINNLCEILASMLKQPTYQPFVRESVPKRVFKREGQLEINPLLLQAFGITPEELGDVIKSAEEPEAMRDMFAFLSDYATLSDRRTRLSISGDKLDFLVADLKRRMGIVAEVYRKQAEEHREFGYATASLLSLTSDKARKLSNFSGMSREDKVAFIDAVVGLEHTSGSIIPIAFGITDYGREDYWPRKLLAFLRSQPGMVREGIAPNSSPELSGLNLNISKLSELNLKDIKGKRIGGVSMIREQTNNGFRANPGLINKQAAYAAHAGTSFEPEKRGEQAIRGFADEVQAVYERLKPHARTDAEKALLISEMERFQASYAQKYNDLLYSHSRIYSTMIAGPSGFPAERMRKINEAYDKKAHEVYEWKDRAEKAMLRALKGLATEEAGGEVAVLKNKIAQAEKLQEMMVEANKIIRKKAEPGIGGISKYQQLINMGFTERQATEAMTPDYLGRKGFPAFALTNNSANIRRMKERLIELEKREVTPTAEITFPGGSIVDNREEDRVQIFFDQKPPQAMIDKLKSEGWRWAPSVGAWSRKRTDMAMNSARRITGAAAPAVQPPAVPQVPVRAAVMYVPPKHPPLLYPAPPQRPAEEIMLVPNPETMTKEEYVTEKYKRMAQVLRQQGKNAIAERVEKGARDPERTFKYETSHRDQVVLALAQGKTVGGDVLKDYPDIVARIRQENEALLAKEKAERERLYAIERAEENELNAELNRLPPSLKRHAETEIYGTLHMPETHKDYRNRYVIALGKVRRIAFTHLPQGKEPIAKKKEPWEMTQEEYWRAGAEGRAYEGRGTSDYNHRQAVYKAILEGKPVSANVLKDYPDLIRREVPAPLPKIQSIQDVKQQVIQSIQDAKSMDELKQVLKGFGFLPLPEPEKRQLTDLYQVRFSELMGELKFGERIPEDKKKRRAPQKAPYAPPPRRLEEFGIKEAMRRGYGYA